MVKGFFSSSELQLIKSPTLGVPRCGACKLYKMGCNSPKMKPTGEGKKRILIVGEGPGCIAGESLVEVAFRDRSIYPNGIPIKDLLGKSGFYVYSFDIKNQKLSINKVLRVWKTGRKKLFEVTYEWSYVEGKQKKIIRKSVCVTSNHKFLIKKAISHDPFLGIKENRDYVSIDDGLKIGYSIQPFHTRLGEYVKVGAFSKLMILEHRLLLEFKLRRSLVYKEECYHKNKNKHDNSWDNLEVQTIANHSMEVNPMDRKEARENHAIIVKSSGYRENISNVMKNIFKDPNVYNKRLDEIRKSSSKIKETVKRRYQEPCFYYKYLLGRLKSCKNIDSKWVENKFKRKFLNESFPQIDNHKVISIRYVGLGDVYDMEVEEHHNFAVNGIFVHNSSEDREGVQFIGITGQILRGVLSDIGIDVERDCWLTNSVICWPHTPGFKNRTPTLKEIEYCRPNLLNTVQELDPNVVVLLGGVAVHSLIGNYWKDEGKPTIWKWTGWQIPLHKPNIWICPTWHPSFVSRSKDDLVVKKFFRKHLENAVSLDKKPWNGNPPDFRSRVRTIINPEEASEAIEEIIRKKPKLASFDYETTTLKPDGKYSEIDCCSICDGDVSISYPWYGPAIKSTQKFLKDKDIGKIGFNIKFEDRWTRRQFGHKVINWKWDGMIAAHVLDNRKGICGLKFQSFVLLGQGNYDNHISPYLKSIKPGCNEVNRVKEIGIRQRLLYCGMDSLLEYEVAIKQMRKFGIYL